ncbi:sorting nexin-24 isoform X4 [Antechinus flavipes]|uniref:sorting nexin-24 isoform X4 n=1 Tax=Antechinus flavipes TaxID=38775 RepID=UPI002236691F|nr:sorting nexin-24 isoform X4 [Antechinus flavipes]
MVGRRQEVEEGGWPSARPAQPGQAMEVYIPSFRYEESELERGYTVFKIEVLMSGRKHFVEKRYSEFHALHKKLKKCIKTPEIPSKHVRNWVPKVLEQRRQGLEAYLQAVILENEELPKLFLDFLNIRHLPSLPKTESCGSFEETESEESSKLSHQPVLLFLRDPYVLPTANDHFPNVVIEGVLHGIFYPHLQPSMKSEDLGFNFNSAICHPYDFGFCNLETLKIKGKIGPFSRICK